MHDDTTSEPEIYPDEVGFESDALSGDVDESHLRRRDHRGKPYMRSMETICAEVCESFLETNSVSGLRRRNPRRVADDLLGLINDKISSQNEQLKENLVAGHTLSPLKRLGFAEIAALIIAVDQVVAIMPNNMVVDPGSYVVAVYDDEPASPHYGTYRASQSVIFSRAARYLANIATKEFAEIYSAARRSAPRVVRGENKDLLAVNNGIVDYNGGEPIFMDFSPEHVFLSKLAVDWNPDAENIIIHNDADGTDWDVESWMAELSDDPEVVELLWQVIGATVRPYVSWNTAAFFLATSGNNGKGTLVAAIRNLLGSGNHTSIPLTDFSKDFMLEPLMRSSAILVDENDVGSYIDRSANLKAVITNDVITINGKHKAPVIHQHFGFMVQCMNDKPSVRDKSESWYRRQRVIPFTKSFTGVERKYIKDDYLQRREVLEYVLKRVLTMNYYSLDNPETCRLALEETKEANDPVRSFWNEKKFEFSWDLVPFQFAYDLYRAWLDRNHPQNKAVGRNKFIDELVELVNADKLSPFECSDKAARHRPSGHMNAPEPLSVEFDLQDWMNLSAPVTNPDKRSVFPAARQKSVYRGLTRQALTPERIAAGTPEQQPPAEPDPAEVEVLPASAAGGRALFEQWVPADAELPAQPVSSSRPSLADACQSPPAYEG